MKKSNKIAVKSTEVTVVSIKEQDYISLTDIAKHKNSNATGLVISHWLSTRYTIDFMGLWEKMIILILMLRNSVTLEMNPAQMVLYYRVKIGLIVPMQSG